MQRVDTLRAATRDASFYRRPDVHSAKVYHVVRDNDPGIAACGRIVADDTVDASTVGPGLRCQRPGCKTRWPDYDPARTYAAEPADAGVRVDAPPRCTCLQLLGRHQAPCDLAHGVSAGKGGQQ